MTPAANTPLTGKQKSYLRALAHPLKPVVQVGHGGLTEAVLGAIERALVTHELIKIRVSAGEDPEAEPSELGIVIEQRTRSRVAQVIGKTLVVYRARKKDPAIVLPKPGSQAKPARARRKPAPVRPPRPRHADE